MNDRGFGSQHPGRCNYVTVDGSVGFFQEDMDLDALPALSSCNGEEPPAP